jgi:hypothetical protein
VSPLHESRRRPPGGDPLDLRSPANWARWGLGILTETAAILLLMALGLAVCLAVRLLP